MNLLNKKYLVKIARETLAVSSLTYLTLFLLEWLSPGSVSLYFNADIVLYFTLLAGVIYLSIK